MAECINREAFKKSVEERYCKPCKAEGKDHNGCWCRACWVDDMLDEVECFQPSDVAPVVHGRWIDKGEYAVCTECGGRSGTQYEGVEPIPLMTQFCQNCGCHMDGGED